MGQLRNKQTIQKKTKKSKANQLNNTFQGQSDFNDIKSANRQRWQAATYQNMYNCIYIYMLYQNSLHSSQLSPSFEILNNIN